MIWKIVALCDADPAHMLIAQVYHPTGDWSEQRWHWTYNKVVGEVTESGAVVEYLHQGSAASREEALRALRDVHSVPGAIAQGGIPLAPCAGKIETVHRWTEEHL